MKGVSSDSRAGFAGHSLGRHDFRGRGHVALRQALEALVQVEDEAGEPGRHDLLQALAIGVTGSGVAGESVASVSSTAKSSSPITELGVCAITVALRGPPVPRR